MHAKMVVIGLAIDPQHKTPLVTLRESGTARTLAVAVGVIEAGAIAFALEKVHGRRPSTHDLLFAALGALGGMVVRVTLRGSPQGGPQALVTLRQGSQTQGIEAQASDGIALALRCDAPIYCTEDLLTEHAARRHFELACPTHLQPPSVVGVGVGEGGLEGEQRSSADVSMYGLLDSMAPEDFGKYKM